MNTLDNTVTLDASNVSDVLETPLASEPAPAVKAAKSAKKSKKSSKKAKKAQAEVATARRMSNVVIKASAKHPQRSEDSSVVNIRSFTDKQRAQIVAVMNDEAIKSEGGVCTRGTLRAAAKRTLGKEWCPPIIVKNDAFKIAETHLFVVDLTADGKLIGVVEQRKRAAAFIQRHNLVTGELPAAPIQSEPAAVEAQPIA